MRDKEMVPLTFAIILILVKCAQTQSELICGTKVVLSLENTDDEEPKNNDTLFIPLERESFNATLEIKDVKVPTKFNLESNWERLEISETEIEVSKDTNVNLIMNASHFYLFEVNISCSNVNSTGSKVFEVPVGRTKTESLIATIFQRVMMVFVAFAMFLMGCELKFEIVRAYLRRPLAPIGGMVAQYVFMPVMAYLIGLAMMPDKVMARYGLILVGSSPGGSFSNFWTALWGGDLDLSVTMTFCSTVASFATTTFWVWLFGRFVLNSEKNFSLPYLQLFISLVSLVIPVFLGLLITWWRPTWSQRLIKLSRPLFTLMMIVVSTLGLYTNRFFFSVVSWYDLVAAACTGFSGYIIGIIISLILRLNRKQVIALSLETAIQNASIAIIILQTNLPSPYADMALMPVIGYIFTSSGLLNIVLYTLFRTFLYLRSCISPSASENQKNIPMREKNNQGFSPD